jgi:hypothetical protein
MRFHRSVLSILSVLGLALGTAAPAGAEGACVHVVDNGDREVLRCADGVASMKSCAVRSHGDDGEFHPGRECQDFGYGKTWGVSQPPAKPAADSPRGGLR